LEVGPAHPRPAPGPPVRKDQNPELPGCSKIWSSTCTTHSLHLHNTYTLPRNLEGTCKWACASGCEAVLDNNRPAAVFSCLPINHLSIDCINKERTSRLLSPQLFQTPYFLHQKTSKKGQLAPKEIYNIVQRLCSPSITPKKPPKKDGYNTRNPPNGLPAHKPTRKATSLEFLVAANR
jgi:hypothetical protein